MAGLTVVILLLTSFSFSGEFLARVSYEGLFVNDSELLTGDLECSVAKLMVVGFRQSNTFKIL